MWVPYLKKPIQITIDKFNTDGIEAIKQKTKGKLPSITIKEVSWDIQKWRTFFEYFNGTTIQDLTFDGIANISDVISLMLDTNFSGVQNFQVIHQKTNIISREAANNIHQLFSENKNFVSISLEGIKLPAKVLEKIGNELISNKLLSHVKLAVNYNQDSSGHIKHCINHLLYNNTLIFFGLVCVNDSVNSFNIQLEIEALRRCISVIMKANKMIVGGLFKHSHEGDTLIIKDCQLSFVNENGVLFRKLSSIYPNTRKIILNNVQLSKLFRHYFENFKYLEEIEVSQAEQFIISPSIAQLPTLKDLNIDYSPKLVLYPKKYLADKFSGLRRMNQEALCGTTTHTYLRIIPCGGDLNVSKSFQRAFSNYLMKIDSKLTTHTKKNDYIHLTTIGNSDQTQSFTIWNCRSQSLINSCVHVTASLHCE